MLSTAACARLLGIALATSCVVFPLACALHALPMRLPPAAVESQALVGAVDVAACLRTGVPLRGVAGSAIQATGPATLLGALAAAVVAHTGWEPLSTARLVGWLCVAAAAGLLAWLAYVRARPLHAHWSYAACAGISAAASFVLVPWLLVQSMTYGSAGAVALMAAATLLCVHYAGTMRAWWVHTLCGAVLGVSILANAEWALVWIPTLLAAHGLNVARTSGWRAAGRVGHAFLGAAALLLFWRQDLWLGPHNISATAVAANAVLVTMLVIWGIWLRRGIADTHVQGALLIAAPLMLWLLWWLSCSNNTGVVRMAVKNGLLMSRGDGAYVASVIAHQFAGSALARVLAVSMVCVGCYTWWRTTPGMVWLLLVCAVQLWRSPVHVSCVLAMLRVMLALAAGSGVAWLGHCAYGRWHTWRVLRVAERLSGGAPLLVAAALYCTALWPGVLPRIWTDYEPPHGAPFHTLDSARTWWHVLDVISNTIPLTARVSYTPDQFFFSRFTVTAFARAARRDWQIVPWPPMAQTPVPDAADFYVLATRTQRGGMYLDAEHLAAHYEQHVALLDADPAWELRVDTTNALAHVRLRIYGRAIPAAP